MRKCFSYFNMKWKHAARWIYLVLLGMSCSELLFFYISMKRAAGGTTDKAFINILSDSHFDLIFTVFLILEFIVVCYTYCETGMEAAGRITLFRMNITPRMQLITGWLLSTGCFFMLYFTQIILCVFAYLMFVIENGMDVEYAMTASNGLYTAFYRIDFLYRLYPVATLGDMLLHVLCLAAVFVQLSSVFFLQRSENTVWKRIMFIGASAVYLIMLLWRASPGYRQSIYLLICVAIGVFSYMKNKGEGEEPG